MVIPIATPPASVITRRLKLRSLDILLAVIACGSMARAAKQLALSQPAVSKAIAEMELTLGVPLFDRTAQGVEANRYGHALRRSALAVVDDIEQGVREIGFLADPTAGELRIGATEPMIAGFLPAVLQRIWRRHPRIVVDVIQTATRSDQYRELREHNVDFILGRVQPSAIADDLVAEVLFQEPVFVASGAQNPLARRRNLQIVDLLAEPWTLPQSDTVVGTYIEEAFAASGAGFPRAVVRSASIQMHYGLITSGPFLALLPLSMVRYSVIRTAIKVLPVTLPNAPPPIGILTLKDRAISPVAKLFVEFARAAAKPLLNVSAVPSGK